MARQKKVKKRWEKWPRCHLLGFLGWLNYGKGQPNEERPASSLKCLFHAMPPASHERAQTDYLCSSYNNLAGRLFSPLPPGPALKIFVWGSALRVIRHPSFRPLLDHHNKHTENSGLYTTHTYLSPRLLFLFLFFLSRLWNGAQGKSQTHDERIYSPHTFWKKKKKKKLLFQDLPQERVRWWSEPRTRGLCGTGGRPTQ
jgi:hypothetical protein